tara:strand:+ start:392 stop:499 length:108 start_codon:yes stop_codon:yes gene_type:complete
VERKEVFKNKKTEIKFTIRTRNTKTEKDRLTEEIA